MSKDIKLIWQKPCKLENLDNFFGEHEGMGGLYLWVFKGKTKHIRYIGEAANFQKRFNEHLKNITHGLYTAIDCPDNQDLANKYKEIVKTGVAADQTNKWLCYHPKPTTFNGDALKKYIEDVKQGIDLSLGGFLSCYFLFAEIKYKGASADEYLRKEVESIFMKMLKKAYEEEKNIENLHWCGFNRTNTEFWGTISKHNERNCLYNFTNDGEELDNVLKNIGISEKEGRTWGFTEVEKGKYIF